MNRQKQTYVLEYSHYELPVGFPILGLTGDRWSLPDDEITFLHCHNCIEIGLCQEGEGVVIVENKTRPFVTDDFFITCANTMHRSRSRQDTTSRWEYIYVDAKVLFREYLNNSFPNASLLMFDSPDFPNIVSGKTYPYMKQLFLQIVAELTGQKEDYQTSAACLCISFLIQLIRILPRESGMDFCYQKNKMTIYPAILYVEEHYMEPIAIEVLADACCLSLTHFRRLFKVIMNETPLDYVNRIRINKSCELLYNTEDSVLSIALQVGFSGNTSYNRNFRTIMGTTPLQWRKKSRHMSKRDMEFSVFPGPFNG